MVNIIKENCEVSYKPGRIDFLQVVPGAGLAYRHVGPQPQGIFLPVGAKCP